MFFRGLYISQKKSPNTHHTKYHFCSMRLSCLATQYLLCTLGDSHYFLLRMLLPYDMNQLYMVACPLKYAKALQESLTLGDLHHSLWLMLLSYDANSIQLVGSLRYTKVLQGSFTFGKSYYFLMVNGSESLKIVDICYENDLT